MIDTLILEPHQTTHGSAVLQHPQRLARQVRIFAHLASFRRNAPMALRLRWRLLAQVHEGRHPSAQKRGGTFESRNIVRVPLVTPPTSRLATPFDKGEYGTDELIQITLCSQYSLILPGMSSLA